MSNEIYIDGVPARQIGELIRHKGLRSQESNEIYYCRGCQKDFKYNQMALPLHLGRKGYSGYCKTCDEALKNEGKR